jgi:hypothetical protein
MLFQKKYQFFISLLSISIEKSIFEVQQGLCAIYPTQGLNLSTRPLSNNRHPSERGKLKQNNNLKSNKS